MLSSLLILPHQHPTKNNEIEEFVMRKKEMERISIDRNSPHLNQAHQSSVVQSDIVIEIAEEMIKNRILEGNYAT